MFSDHRKQRAGVAKIPSDGEELFVTKNPFPKRLDCSSLFRFCEAEQCFLTTENSEPGLPTLSVIRLDEVAKIPSDGEELFVTRNKKLGLVPSFLFSV